MSKNFRLAPHQFKPLVANVGGCIATDRITVAGERVGLMYREEPAFDGDSGWRFEAGDETDEYLADATNYEIYDVNTIANYDPAVIPYLKRVTGSELYRDSESDEFFAV